MVAFSFCQGTIAVAALKERHGKAKLSAGERLAQDMVHLCLKPKNKSYWGFAVNLMTHTHTKTGNALCMTHILDMTARTKEVVGIAAGLFRLIKLLAGTNSFMTKPPWSWVYQGFSESFP